MSSSGRKRLNANCFLPDRVKKRLESKQLYQKEVDEVVCQLQNLRVATIIDKGLDMSEDRALLIISGEITFRGVLFLKMTLNHVPPSFSAVSRGTHVALRYILMSEIMLHHGFSSMSPTQVEVYVQFLQQYCPNFLEEDLSLIEGLWKLTAEGKLRFNRFLSPPVKMCLFCARTLTMHNKTTNAIVFTLSGPQPASKIILDCNHCKVKYGISRFSGDSGEHYYPKKFTSPLVEVSNVTYLDKALYDWLPSLSNHCWVSFSGFAETYNEVHAEDIDLFKKHVSKSSDNTEEDFDSISSEMTCDSEEHGEQVNILGEITNKYVAKSYWKYELEKELDDLGIREAWVFSPSKGEMKGSEDDAMEYIGKLRSESLYFHDCSQNCQKKGCGKLYVADGNWKLKYPHCMWHVPVSITGFAQPINYPSICPVSPIRGKAFCSNHCATAERGGLPTGLQDFLKHCGVRGQAREEGASAEDESHLQNTIKSICTTSNSSSQDFSVNATTYQGISEFVVVNGDFLMDNCSGAAQAATTVASCNKDTGGRNTLQSWSRGIFFIVSGGGHISYWQPLYRSESPTQAFLITILWLYRKFKPLLDKGTPKEKVVEQMTDIVLAYDNMCNVDGLKIAQSLLPFDKPLDEMWLCITKVIDRLHLRNHKQMKCKTTYNPEGKIPAEFNTMAAEQTFVWASRLKRIICAMPRVHQFFFIHRAVKMRNSYTQRCHENNKIPILPKGKDFYLDK